MAIKFGETKTGGEQKALPDLNAKERRSHPDFFLSLHPDNWFWDRVGKCWLPDPGKLILSPGVGGCSEGRGGRIDSTMAEASAARQGWKVIPPGDASLRGCIEGGEYKAKHPAAGGSAYTWAWEGYEISRGGAYWEADHAVKFKFLKGLVDNGVVPPMHRRLKLDEIRIAKNRVRRLEAQVARTPQFPDLAVRLGAAQEYVADLEADLAGKPSEKKGGAK